MALAECTSEELAAALCQVQALENAVRSSLVELVRACDERKLWADRLQRLLDGSVTTDLRCHLIDVRLGIDSESLTNRTVLAHEGQNAIPVEITELNERQIEVLIPSEPPEPEAEEGGQGGEPEPPAGPTFGRAPSYPIIASTLTMPSPSRYRV